MLYWAFIACLELLVRFIVGPFRRRVRGLGLCLGLVNCCRFRVEFVQNYLISEEGFNAMIPAWCACPWLFGWARVLVSLCCAFAVGSQDIPFLHGERYHSEEVYHIVGCPFCAVAVIDVYFLPNIAAVDE